MFPEVLATTLCKQWSTSFYFQRIYLLFFQMSVWNLNLVRDHPFSTYAKYSEKLTFLTPLYAHIHAHIRGLEMLAFQKKFVHTKWMIPWPILTLVTRYTTAQIDSENNWFKQGLCKPNSKRYFVVSSQVNEYT